MSASEWTDEQVTKLKYTKLRNTDYILHEHLIPYKPEYMHLKETPGNEHIKNYMKEVEKERRQKYTVKKRAIK